MNKEHLLGKTLEELKNVAAELRLPAFVGKQMCQWIYEKKVTSIDEMTNLAKKARILLNEKYDIGCSAPVKSQHSKDGTIKYLYQTAEGHFIESVFIPSEDRGTLCVSSQVGCKMGCKFCMTGRQGFESHLSVCDILNQIYSLPEKDKLTNIVFMGQGEPLDNLDNVLKATKMLTDENGYGWSAKRITVSTVGISKGLRRFIEESKCHLAVSLHFPFAEEREKFMPAEKGMSIKKIVDELKLHEFCRDLGKGEHRDDSHQRRLSFEYIVFSGINDTERHAAQLVNLLKGLDCRVNLIRFHEIPDTEFRTTSEESILWFRNYLTSHGLFSTIRASRGEDIFAACGLLTTAEQEARNKN